MIARGGRGFVGLSAAGSVALLFLHVFAAIALAVLTGFLVFVYRDPKRPAGRGIVAPADGRVREVDTDNGYVSTYLALRNVHVTRSPIDGIVESAVRSKGRHAPAFSKRTHENERLDLSFNTKIGSVKVVQMVGAIARRIVPYVVEGQTVGKGDKLGLIRFGSRVDVYLPPKAVRITVRKGQKLRAGITSIAEAVDGSVE